MIGSVLSVGFSQAGTLSFSSALTLSASTVLKDFFKHLVMHPEKHMMAVIVMGVVVIAGCVGLAFLIKKVYERCCPEPRVT